MILALGLEEGFSAVVVFCDVSVEVVAVAFGTFAVNL
jgi:hypothetical protein